MKQIEHNRYERRPTNTVWIVGAGLLAFLWAGYFWFRSPDWWSICLGAGSAAIVVCWFLEKFEKPSANP